MNLNTLKFRLNDGVARITLSRPDDANAINLTMAQELLKTIITCDVDSSVRAVLLDAEGRLFSAGGDLGHFAKAGETLPAVLKELTATLHAAISHLAHMRAPVIASVQGAAAGAGFSLACACDLVLAAKSAKFTLAYTKAGLVPDGSSTYFLPRLLGRRKALEMMLLNPVLTAEEAHQLGLVNRVIHDDDLITESLNLAAKLGAGPTNAYAATKRLLLASSHETLESQMALEASAIAEIAADSDGQEGIAAFLEKRQPHFQG